MTSTTVQVHQIYIKATPQAIWDAITKPEWTARYGYAGYFESSPRTGAAYRMLNSEHVKKAGEQMGFDVPDVAVDGEFIEVDPPRRLVQTWRMVMDPTMAAEGFTRLTHEIEEINADFSKLTVLHELTGAPSLAAMVAGEQGIPGQGGGGWPWVLSDLKSVLETGQPLSTS